MKIKQYLCFFLVIVVTIITSCYKDQSDNEIKHLPSNDFMLDLQVFGPFLNFIINDSIYNSRNYFGPKNVNKHLGYFF